MNLIANYEAYTRANCLKSFKKPLLNLAALSAICLLIGCATPQPPTLKAVYDFGPAVSMPATTQSAAAINATRSAAIALPEIEASGSLQSPALLYRLQYNNAQELRPYAQARWSVPPAQLVRARIRDALAQERSVLSTEGAAAFTLRIELDEFSHIFETPEKSQGLLRLRASLFKGEQLTAQTTLVTRANAPSQDAAGGVKALTAAADEAAKLLGSWVAEQIR